SLIFDLSSVFLLLLHPLFFFFFLLTLFILHRLDDTVETLVPRFRLLAGQLAVLAYTRHAEARGYLHIFVMSLRLPFVRGRMGVRVLGGYRLMSGREKEEEEEGTMHGDR
ncbi:hypothetical protein PENTCL1PPCAC_27494, partial [Pristionchus entomophagus]